MKRRIGICLCLFIIFLGLVYYKPMKLSDLTSEYKYVNMIVIEDRTSGGVPDLESENYDDLTYLQQKEIISTLQNYSYRRKLATIFSDGDLENFGDRIINIFVFNQDTTRTTIMITEDDRINVDGKIYRLSDSKELVEELLNIVKE